MIRYMKPPQRCFTDVENRSSHRITTIGGNTAMAPSFIASRDHPASETALWKQRVRDFDKSALGTGIHYWPQLLALHDYDNACTSLLWMPLVAPLDPPTTVACTKEAIAALRAIRPYQDAAKLQLQLETNSPGLDRSPSNRSMSEP